MVHTRITPIVNTRTPGLWEVSRTSPYPTPNTVMTTIYTASSHPHPASR